MPIRELLALDDGVTDADIAQRPRQAEHDVRERDDTEVRGCKQAGEQHADAELQTGAGDCATEPPAGGPRRSGCQSVGDRHRQTVKLSAISSQLSADAGGLRAES